MYRLTPYCVDVTITISPMYRDRVCCEYKGINISQSQRCSSTISPCGGLLFAAAQPGQVLVWNTDNGESTRSFSAF